MKYYGPESEHSDADKYAILTVALDCMYHSGTEEDCFNAQVLDLIEPFDFAENDSGLTPRPSSEDDENATPLYDIESAWTDYRKDYKTINKTKKCADSGKA